jgi:translation initiation factor 2B subunit (eIF-2B alpha/beta/delta family)
LHLLDAAAIYVSSLTPENWDEGVRHLNSCIRKLSLAQSSMPQIAGIGERIGEVTRRRPDFRAGHKDSVRGRLANLRKSIIDSRSRVAENIASLLPPGSTVVTLSYSSEVLEGITRAHQLGGVGLVIVSESRPGTEGIALCRALRERGIPTRLIPDAAIARAVAEADIGLVGADSVSLGGAVSSKIGSHLLALACRQFGKPFCVTCSSFKIGRAEDRAKSGGNEIKENPLFESTSPALVSRYITEDGVLTPVQFRYRYAKGQAKGPTRCRGA